MFKIEIGDLSFEGDYEDFVKLGLKDRLDKINLHKMIAQSNVSEKISKEYLMNMKRQLRNSQPLTDSIYQLMKEGKLNEPKSLSEIKGYLDDVGCIKENNSISPILLRLTREGLLNRSKNGGGYYKYQVTQRVLNTMNDQLKLH